MSPTLFIKIILLGLVQLIFTAGKCQDSTKIQFHLDQFYENQYIDVKLANAHLDSGITLAKASNNQFLIALGHKYKSWYYEDLFLLDSALIEISLSKDLFLQLNNQKEVANCYNTVGNLHSDNGNMEEAIIAYETGLSIALEINDTEVQATFLNNLGVLYSNLGDFVKTVDYYWKSLKLCEQNNDELGTSDCWNNLGSAYSDMGDFDQALEYHEKALEIREKYDDLPKKSSVYLNIGRVFLAQQKFSKSREYFHKSVSIDHEIEDFDGAAIGYSNIGLSFFRENQNDSAIKYYQLALIDRNKTENPFGYCLIYSNMGDYYAFIGDYNRAELYCKKSYDISKPLNFNYELNAACECLYEVNRAKGNNKKALLYLEEFVATSDSIRAESKTKEVTKKQMEYQYYTQSLQDSLIREEFQRKREMEHQFELKKQVLEKEAATRSRNNQLMIFMVIALVLIINVAIVFYKYKGQKIQRLLIEEQKMVIEEKSHDIQQSIDYAKLIQTASLPEKQLESIFPDSFIFYQPKDVVSGDFYWLEDNDRYSSFSVADCTGHGIPGAFISLIGTILLNEIYNSKKLILPNHVLDELNRLIQLTLRQSNNRKMMDGMDISFCCWDKTTGKLYYSGANNPLWVVSNASTLTCTTGSDTLELQPDLTEENGKLNLFEVKADRQPVGNRYSDSHPFTLHELLLSKGDVVYLFSDGFPDQFGGESLPAGKAGGKKFKHKNMKKLFLSQVDHSMNIQLENIRNSFNEWKKDFEQIDDVCIIGVRI